MAATNNTGGESPRLSSTDVLDELSVEQHFEGIEIHDWKKQLTPRVFGISFIVGTFMTIVFMKLCLYFSHLAPFYIPVYPFSLILLESTIMALHWFGLFKNPITRQEISVMQACVVAFSKIVYYGGNGCGFYVFPTFGLQAVSISFYSSLTPAYIAIGMICPHSLVFSFFVGAIISWGFFWPFISSKEGVWYPKGTTPDSVIDGSYGYKVSLTSALFLGEGIFQLSLLALHKFYDMYLKKKPKRFIIPFHEEEEEQQQQQNIFDSQITATMSHDDQLRTKMFLKDIEIPTPISIGGFLLTATISTVAIPFIFPQIEPRHIAAAYIAVPIINFCNAYTVGIADFNFAPRYGKLIIFIFGSWIGLRHGGVLGGLIASSIVIAVISTATDLMQNLKLAYMTLTSPRSLLIGQVIGTVMGCIIVPIVFFYFYNSPDFGDPKSEYSMENARLSRAFAIRVSQGLDSLPTHCVTLAVISFMVSISLNIVREMARLMKWRFYAYIPSPVAMAVPFYFTAAASLDACLGNLVVFVWKRNYKKSTANLYILTVATGLFIAEGLKRLMWALLDRINAPMCVAFFSRDFYMSSHHKNLTSYPY
ncbi:hypothetical protein J5N97_023752 [Dioscorea zingiberensis]|uniref:Uncharacterized protein n=1 Tax=Dioscorea zingiberensis TaxID=325984 RepID=A0A9D5C5U5_9LILI|nr:hypothetical protein J5N97_023752 [Dioscorea zingiberensis]